LRAAKGPWPQAREAAGLHASVMPWLKKRDIALLGTHTGVTPAPDSPEEFAQYLTDEYTRRGRIIREKGIKVE